MSVWRAGRILAVGGAAALGLVGLVAWEGRARAQGAEARMAVEGFDPRNLLTGHYAAIELLDQLPAGAPCPALSDDARGRSWIVLRPAGDRHRVAAAFPSRAEAQRFGRGLIVRGQVSCRGADAVIRTQLGVERFHASQAQAEAIEDALRTQSAEGEPAYAVLSIGEDGRARLKGLIVGGRRVDLDWF